MVDDNSSDRTADIARHTASRLGKSESLTVMRGRPLPPGWSGKLWAMQQGIEAARRFHADYLLLTDADIVHAPHSLESLLAFAQAGRYDLVSQMVKLHCSSLAEKLLIPAFVFFFFKLYPPEWIADPRARTAGAAGGCVLLSPQALACAGGLEAIRGEIIDDCALARAVKRSGARVYLGLTADTASIRAYRSFAEIGRMIARTAFNQLHHSGLLLIAALGALAVTYVAPVLLLFSARRVPTVLGAVAWAAMALAYLPMIRFYRLRSPWASVLPFSALFYMGATVRSALNFWSHRGGEWKGRVQDVATPAPKAQPE